MAVAPALALPEAIPEAIPELYNRAQCIGGDNLVGSGCGPRQKGKTSCSANDRAVVCHAGHNFHELIHLIHDFPMSFSFDSYVFGKGVVDRELTARRSSALARVQCGKSRTSAREALATTTASVPRRLTDLEGRKSGDWV